MSPNRQIHVVLFDGTLASLDEGRDSNIGRIHALLDRIAPRSRLRVHYVAGQQWEAWGEVTDLALCRAIPGRISHAYGWLASRYRPGDVVFLFGYSRGAYAVRSLAGMIGRVGLLRAEHATERNVRLAWTWYQRGPAPRGLGAFRRRCHEAAPIRMVGVFDTVKAMGLRLPLLWLLTEGRYAFHDHHSCEMVENGVQALALDETRAVFEPVMWRSDSGCAPQRLRQMWFRGCHADIGGQLGGFEAARGLANLPLVWMLEEAEALGLPLPAGWRAGLPTDPSAPAVGSWRGWGKMFLLRAPRVAGRDVSERLHASVPLAYDGPALLTGALAAQAAEPLPLRRRAAQRLGGLVGGRPA